MKLLVSVCVFSALLVMSYAIPRKYRLVNELAKDLEECKKSYPYNDNQALVCANYKFGILEAGPKINFNRFIAAEVEYSKWLHSNERSDPVLNKDSLVKQSKYCRTLKSKDALTLLLNVQACMSPKTRNYSDEQVLSSLVEFSSGENLDESEPKPTPSLRQQLARGNVFF